MTPFFVVIFLLCHSSLAIAANFTQVFAWNEMDFEWPSEASRIHALEDGTFKPENIEPLFMAVYGTRIFLSLEIYNVGIPVSLVSLPTSNASSASPKLTPFPSWEMHELGNCNKIERAKGLEVDSLGRLWVLDDGSINCNSKLWIFDLSKNDRTNLIHRFFLKWMHDFVLDETPNEIFAYITRWMEQNIVVFSSDANKSWVVETPGIKAYSIALSPKEEPRQLYISNSNSDELYSVSVTALRNGFRTAYPKLIGKWTEEPYRMLMDNHGTMYATFHRENFIHSWNSSRPFQEQQRMHEVAGLNAFSPFTFALDQNGFLWVTVFERDRKPRHKLLKAAVGAKSYTYEPSSPEKTVRTMVQKNSILKDKLLQSKLFNIILICSNVFSVVLLGLIILWLILRKKRNNSLPQNTNKALQMSEFPVEPAEYHEVQDEVSRGAAEPSAPEYVQVGPAKGLYEEVKYINLSM